MPEIPTPRQINEALKRSLRLRIYASLVALTMVTVLFGLSGLEGWIRQVIALVTITLVPGAAVVGRLPRVNLLLEIGLTAVISLVIFTLGSGAMILAGWFHPWLLAVIVLVPSCVGLLDAIRVAAIEPKRKRRRQRQATRAKNVRGVTARPRRGERKETPLERLPGWTGAALPIVLAVLIWMLSLSGIDGAKMDGYGLPSVLPFGWFLAYAIVIGGGAAYAFSRKPRPAIMAAYVLAAIVIVYATIPLTFDEPHLPWVYKHVGVVNEFLTLGHTLPDADIYNRWPAMFALGASFMRIAGVSDPIRVVGWSELYFIAIQSTLVAAIAWRETKKIGIAGISAMFFVLINWIGQGYFSPQALAFTMTLGLVAVVFSQLADGGKRLGKWIMGVMAKIVRTRATWADKIDHPEWSTRTAVAIVLVIYGAIVAAHQLTPYIVLALLGLLWMFGWMRPRWLLMIGAGAIAFLYLAPSLGWVNKNYGLFNFDPGSNAQVQAAPNLQCDEACSFNGAMTLILTMSAWLLALISVFLLSRRRPNMRVPLLAAGFTAPFLTVLGQSYGGEAALRIVMFAAPFTACLIAAAIATFGERPRRLLAMGITALFAITFLFAYAGSERNYFVSSDAVKISEYFYANAPTGTVLASTAPNFPGQLGGNYASFRRENGGAMPLIWADDNLRNRESLGKKDVPELVRFLNNFARRGFVAFSDDQTAFAERLGVAKPGEIANLERAMVETGIFKLWKRIGDQRIYKLVKLDAGYPNG